MFAEREVVGCWAQFSPSAGGSEPSTDKTESTNHCVVSFVMPGDLSNTASKQKMATFMSVSLQQWTSLNFNLRIAVKTDI